MGVGGYRLCVGIGGCDFVKLDQRSKVSKDRHSNTDFLE